MNGLSRLATWFTPTITLPNLQSIAARLTIGGAVCFTEGLSSSINVMLPKNHWYYVGTLMLAFFTWLAFARFRRTRLGADTWDLCAWDLLFLAIATLCYFAKIDPVNFLYTSNAISILKLIRVYVWQGATPQAAVWPVFGLGSYWYQKHCPPEEQIQGRGRQTSYYGMALALAIAVLGSVYIQALSEWERVALTWVVPLAFELLYGPYLLDTIKQLTTNLLHSAQHGRELEANLTTTQDKLAQCEAENHELRQRLHAPKQEHIALLQAFDAVNQDRQSAVLQIVRDMADIFPDRPSKPT